jgi:hypothetical protein
MVHVSINERLLLEYPDYYPHRSDQPEYQLNTQVIQHGYKATAILEVRIISCDTNKWLIMITNCAIIIRMNQCRREISYVIIGRIQTR